MLEGDCHAPSGLATEDRHGPAGPRDDNKKPLLRWSGYATARCATARLRIFLWEQAYKPGSVTGPLTLPSPPSRGARSMRSYQSAVCFCGAFLGVAPTGSYPAPCPLVSGLSSESLRFSAVARPAPAIILAFPEVHRNRMPGVAQARNAEGHGIGCYLRSKCSCKNATVRSQASCAACALKASGRSFSINQCPVPGYL